MGKDLLIYNTLSRKKEKFVPIHPPHVGLYVCGPTVYSKPHLGHARPAIVYDVLFRLLKNSNYKVRYVQNITDVGHLENDADEGEDKISKIARLEQVEPMEVAQYYTNQFHRMMNILNVLPPSIEPLASGHIIEQIELIHTIIDNGYAYLSNGSVYFDVVKYNKKYNYGKLSGRRIEELLDYTRELEGKEEKRNSFDFALWKKADPDHIMKWPSPWSTGYPGWHLECTAMGTKYLGKTFDIHGGGMDLQFPHHECEIAQAMASNGTEHVKYWIHNNMITINGQKMSRSLGNYITLEQIFNGEHDLLKKAFSPMTVRFFVLQAHYRSTLDFSNEALIAAEKGLKRMFHALQMLEKIEPSKTTSIDIQHLNDNCVNAIYDDLNTPVLLAHLFDGVKLIYSIYEKNNTINQSDLKSFRKLFHLFVYDILGLTPEVDTLKQNELSGALVELLLQFRNEAKQKKDYSQADKIRNELGKLGIIINDTKDGVDWDIQ